MKRKIPYLCKCHPLARCYVLNCHHSSSRIDVAKPREFHSAQSEKPSGNLRITELTNGAMHLRFAPMREGATNSYLRRIHCFALDMSWLPWPVLPRKRWPAFEFEEERAITFQEHQNILLWEHNPEWRAYYELLWHLGGSQPTTTRTWPRRPPTPSGMDIWSGRQFSIKWTAIWPRRQLIATR